MVGRVVRETRRDAAYIGHEVGPEGARRLGLTLLCRSGRRRLLPTDMGTESIAITLSGRKEGVSCGEMRRGVAAE